MLRVTVPVQSRIATPSPQLEITRPLPGCGYHAHGIEGDIAAAGESDRSAGCGVEDNCFKQYLLASVQAKRCRICDVALPGLRTWRPRPVDDDVVHFEIFAARQAERLGRAGKRELCAVAEDLQTFVVVEVHQGRIRCSKGVLAGRKDQPRIALGQRSNGLLDGCRRIFLPGGIGAEIGDGSTPCRPR